jgi:hypothetical protein
MSLTIKVEDLTDAKDHISGHDTGGGYGCDTAIYIDSRLPLDRQVEVLFHEVIDSYISRRGSNRIRHKDIDPLALDLLDALRQWRDYDAT